MENCRTQSGEREEMGNIMTHVKTHSEAPASGRSLPENHSHRYDKDAESRKRKVAPSARQVSHLVDTKTKLHTKHLHAFLNYIERRNL